jgi:AraC-like DNA-binding protein
MNIASAFITGAELRRRPPAEALREFVGCFWTLPCTADTRIRSLPDGCATLSIHLTANRTPQSFVTGPRLTPGEFAPPADLTLAGVRLRPGVLHALTGTPASRLVGRREPLATWNASAADELERAIACARADGEVFDALESFVGGRLRRMPIDPRMTLAVELLAASHGRLRIADLTRHCGVSARHLNRLFARWIGPGPKMFARIMRFQASLACLDPAVAPALARLADGLGYFDQAHLSNEFLRLAGSSPRRIAPSRVADFSKTQCE